MLEHLDRETFNMVIGLAGGCLAAIQYYINYSINTLRNDYKDAIKQLNDRLEHQQDKLDQHKEFCNKCRSRLDE